MSYCLVIEACVREWLAQGRTIDNEVGETRTRDLSITSQTLWTTELQQLWDYTLYLHCCIVLTPETCTDADGGMCEFRPPTQAQYADIAADLSA